MMYIYCVHSNFKHELNYTIIRSHIDTLYTNYLYSYQLLSSNIYIRTIKIKYIN